MQVKHLWGTEAWLEHNEHYCGKLLTLAPGFRSSLHYHKLKTETWYVVEGTVRLELEGEVRSLSIGDCLTIHQGQRHRFNAAGTKPAMVLEFGTPHYESDTYREEPACQINISPDPE